MRCETCGVEVVAGAAFCPSCGRPLLDQASALHPAATPVTGLQSNVAGGLCYLMGFITGILFLVAEPYKRDPFVRFHAIQAIVLSVAWVVVYLSLGFLLAVLPAVLWRLGWILHSLLNLAFFPVVGIPYVQGL